MSRDFVSDEVYEYKRKALKSCLCVVLWGTIEELCKVFVHREGDNPSSMDGVSDLRDHRSSKGYLRLLKVT